jgi:hypothetical protein
MARTTIQEEYKAWANDLVQRYANAEIRQKAKDKAAAAWRVTKETAVTLAAKYANADVRRAVGKGIVKGLIVALEFERNLIDNIILPKLGGLVAEQEEPVEAEAAQPVANVAVAPVEEEPAEAKPSLLLEAVEDEPQPARFKVLAEDEGLKPAIIRERKPKAKKRTKPLAENDESFQS